LPPKTVIDSLLVFLATAMLQGGGFCGKTREPSKIDSPTSAGLPLDHGARIRGPRHQR